MEQAATTPARVWLVAAALACALLVPSADAGPGNAAPTCRDAGAAGSQISQRQVREAFRCLLNAERTGRRKLRPHRMLHRPARRHSRTMRKHDCLEHQCPGEPALGTRLRKYLRGARKTRYAEVIAVNVAAASPRQIVRQWMTSAPHRELILGRFKHLGVGVAAGDGLAWYTVTLGWKKG